MTGGKRKVARLAGTLVMGALLFGCEASTQVLRHPPPAGIQVQYLAVLFVIEPFSVRTIGTVPPIAGPEVATMPREQAERLGNEIGERLIPQLQARGIRTEYASTHVVRGVAPPPVNQLFPRTQGSRHLLVITPVSERKVCNRMACGTQFTLSLSLRLPEGNREIWNLRMTQSEYTAADIIPGRNNMFIDNIAKSILGVVRASPNI